MNVNKWGGRFWCGIFFCSLEIKLIVVMGGYSFNLDEMFFYFMLLLLVILVMVFFYFMLFYSIMLWIYFVGVVGGFFIVVLDWVFFNWSLCSWMEFLGNEVVVYFGI